MADHRQRKSEYTPERTHAAVEETKKFRAHDLCKASTVESVMALPGVHAGTQAHVCVLHAKHAEEYCSCWCGHRFRVIGKRA